MIRAISFIWLVVAVFFMEPDSVHRLVSIAINAAYGIWADLKELSNVRSDV